MVWAKRATVQIKVGAAKHPSEPEYSPTQIATKMAKKICPREACAMVAHAGVTNFTATPPSAAWARTTITAAQASLVATLSELRSDWQAEACPTHNASPTVSSPT